MRIDKFLWTVRVYKTRSMASEAIRNGRVSIDDNEVKASREVKIGERICIRLHAFTKTIEIKDLPKSRMGAKLVENYIIDHTPDSEYQKLQITREKLVFQRPKGLGRPTKKERRDLDGFMDD
ncbi:MAG: RNA-binding S4 domain-containing protein [Bacteroidales bacterium]|nr:RNA-binding S4 domain-containing protein [Bacteroidales bacterium]